MMSSRFAPAICALLAIALVPTFIHSYSDSAVVDGRSTSAIPEALAGYTSTPSDRNATWGERRFESADWTERIYADGRDQVRLTVVRSYDPKSLYHHPELAVAYGTDYVRSEVRHFPQRPDVPVHMLYTDRPGGSVVMYVLHYDERYVENPIPFQLRIAAELLVSGRKPMTLFFADDLSVGAGEADAPESLRVAALLFEALDQFVAAPAPGP